MGVCYGHNQANIFAALPPTPVLAIAAWVRAGLFRWIRRQGHEWLLGQVLAGFDDGFIGRLVEGGGCN
ncbi:hypothetical protein RHMOL_Rhmol08G0200400 [Rhododendron molle]|uniref:Uncharacterized protein n=1 Tax=Rhododendron molle TaxID=49168 RepID=A0ACC0MQB0_RHOML|nr:hypothetical protein RHMOL_Rhmol08G0200400 [Rhododendron molle]